MDECQNVIAFDDFDAIDDATTENTTTNMVRNSTYMISSLVFFAKKKNCFSCVRFHFVFSQF